MTFAGKELQLCADGCGTWVDAEDQLCNTHRRIRSGVCLVDVTRLSRQTLQDMSAGHPQDPETIAAAKELARRQKEKA